VEFVVVSAAAFAASALTLFSGFGLGTLLMPVVAIFFPVEVAIAITALVHFANNLFKAGLLGRRAHGPILVRFGLPAIAAAFAGAFLLFRLADAPPLHEYTALGRLLRISPLKLVVGVLILVFVLLELSRRFSALKLDQRYLPFGGLLSGFFGGLSGHQGAFRSLFLLKAGLRVEEFVATNVMLALMVDMARLSIYGWGLLDLEQDVNWGLVAAASLAAFAGAFLASRMLKKVTIGFVQLVVSVLLVTVAVGLMSGLL
jgi:uncharacterized protein